MMDFLFKMMDFNANIKVRLSCDTGQAEKSAASRIALYTHAGD